MAVNSMESKAFELLVDSFARDLFKKNEYPFEMPEMLRNICKVLFIHNKKKPVKKYVSVPKDIIYSEELEETLRYLGPIVKKETRGFFSELDQRTIRLMNHPAWRYVIVAFFFLEGSWKAEPSSSRLFNNCDGSKAKVEFISFHGVRVIVRDGQLKAHIRYTANHDGKEGGTVCFSMPTKHDSGIYEHSLLCVPVVDLEFTQEKYGQGEDTTVFKYRYVHNERGFKAVGVCSKNSADGGPIIRQKFVLIDPFQVTIRYKDEDIFKVCVEKLEGVNEMIPDDRDSLSDDRDSLSDKYYCSICKKHMTKPYDLICGHSFHEKCILDDEYDSDDGCPECGSEIDKQCFSGYELFTLTDGKQCETCNWRPIKTVSFHSTFLKVDYQFNHHCFPCHFICYLFNRKKLFKYAIDRIRKDLKPADESTPNMGWRVAEIFREDKKTECFICKKALRTNDRIFERRCCLLKGPYHFECSLKHPTCPRCGLEYKISFNISKSDPSLRDVKVI